MTDTRPNLDTDLGLTDDEFTIADRIERALERVKHYGRDGLTVAVLASVAGTDVDTARRVVLWLLEHARVHTTKLARNHPVVEADTVVHPGRPW